MKENNVSEVLFDDVAILEAKLGQGSLTATTVNANCDCAG